MSGEKLFLLFAAAVSIILMCAGFYVVIVLATPQANRPINRPIIHKVLTSNSSNQIKKEK